jgi:GTP-binding protein
MNVLDAVFVTSGASARDLPARARPQLALVGRSNVGKSSLINALTRRKVARTSAAPGKTRLANLYRVTFGKAPGAGRGRELYLVDLPGYGYARGGAQAAAEFARLAEEYFGAGRREPAPTAEAEAGLSRPDAALLMVDSRHPGLASDVEAWRWLGSLGLPSALVATKIDKLGRAERARAGRELERSFNSPVLPVSAATGEGMDALWKLIATIVSPNPNPPSRP